jgi:hypothetical protein
MQDSRVLSGNILMGQALCVLAKEALPAWWYELTDGLLHLAGFVQRIQI